MFLTTAEDFYSTLIIIIIERVINSQKKILTTKIDGKTDVSFDQIYSILMSEHVMIKGDTFSIKKHVFQLRLIFFFEVPT